MLREILRSLAVTSLAGTALALLLTVSRPITRRVFGCAWHYYIWLAVLVVLVLPVRFHIPQGGRDAVPVPQDRQTQAASQLAEADAEGGTVSAAPDLQAAQTTADGVGRIGRRLSHAADGWLGWVWAVGAGLMLLVYLTGYGRLLARLRKRAVPVSCPGIEAYARKPISVWSCEGLASPFIMGVFRPALVLPRTELSQEQLRNILLHEMTHFRRKDILYKWFAILVKCLHWFNPAVYYVVRQINTECEISCDLSVVSGMNREEEARYVGTILSLLLRNGPKASPLTTGMTGNKKILRRRFEMIKNRRRTGKLASVLSAVTAAVLVTTTVFASGVLAGQSGGGLIINGRSYGIMPVYIENVVTPHTDSYYLPLRDTFEALGYQVDYDVDKDGYTISEHKKHFPAFEIDGKEAADAAAYSSQGWKQSFVRDEATYFIYGATVGLNDQTPIIEMTKDGKTEYCQIGSQRSSMGYLFAAPTLIDGKAYIPIRALAYLLGGEENLKWDPAAHDTYYQGALTFHADTLTVEIKTQ